MTCDPFRWVIREVLSYRGLPGSAIAANGGWHAWGRRLVNFRGVPGRVGESWQDRAEDDMRESTLWSAYGKGLVGTVASQGWLCL